MKIFFSVGEPSGDQHAAELIEEMQRRRPDLEFCGYCGPEMERVGCEKHFQLTDLAVMGIGAVLPLLAKFRRLVKQAEKYFNETPPDAVILVDFPGFNWWIARKAKAAGIPVFYYLPPQLWAWGEWRIKRVRKFVDHMICALPFEPAWYAERGIEVDYVGHPFFDEVSHSQLDESFCAAERTREGRIVGVLPGSRTQEVQRNFKHQIEIMKRVSETERDVRFLVACFKPAQLEYCKTQLQKLDPEGRLPVDLYVGKTSEIIELSTCCVMVSGSVSLELLARKTPAVVLYAAGPVFGPVARWLVNLDTITLPNLMAERPKIYPDAVIYGNKWQEWVGKATGIVKGWLSDDYLLSLTQQRIDQLYDEVVETGAIPRTAETILSYLPESVSSTKAA